MSIPVTRCVHSPWRHTLRQGPKPAPVGDTVATWEAGVAAHTLTLSSEAARVEEGAVTECQNNSYSPS